MKINEIYPTVISWDFAPVFRTLKEAKELAEKYNTKPIKVANGYLVKYTGTISNVCTTGRQMFVIDREGNLHRQILTLIKSHPCEGSYKISGFDGIFINRSNWNCDIYVSVSFDNSKFAEETIKELSQKGYVEYITHMEACKPSKHLFTDAAKTDWQKAKELNYI